MFRFFSILIRKIKSNKKEIKLLQQFNAWKAQREDLQPYISSLKLLIIRLDDIGDYIVFRNFLDAYKISEKWKKYKITLLGNIAWKDLFDGFDKDKVDDTIWIDKKQYLNDEEYRKNTWMLLHNESFEVVICPSRTRPLLLDDLCALAAGVAKKIASANTFIYAGWNKVSDSLYSELFFLKNEYIHEFTFNKLFTEWCCDIKLKTDAPRFEGITKKSDSDYLVFFIGAASKSRRWTVKGWTKLIKLVYKNYQYKIIITGGNADNKNADKISSQLNVVNITGKTSLTEMVNLIAGAKAVVSNNTMAAHIAVACNTPLIIVASGDNYFRFTEYESLNVANVFTVYPKVFKNKLKKYSSDLIHYDAVSADIATISTKTVFEALKKFLL